MQIQEREHANGCPGEKIPSQCPMWDHNNPRGRQNMEEHRTLIIRGTREAAPRSQNAHKTFAEQQKKEETPTEWLEFKEKYKTVLRIGHRYSSWTTFVKSKPCHSCLARYKKKNRLKDGQNRGLNDWLKEPQKVYVSREEEKAKAKAKVMAVAIAQENHCAKTHSKKR